MVVDAERTPLLINAVMQAQSLTTVTKLKDNRMKKTLLSVALIVVSATSALAWDGYDYTNGNFVSIDSGNLVRTGNMITIYDYGTGNYHDVDVQSMSSSGSSVAIEVYDYETGDYRVLEMDN